MFEAALDLVARIVAEGSPAAPLRHAPELSAIDDHVLIAIGRALAEARAESAQEVEASVTAMRAAYGAWRAQPEAALAQAPTTLSPEVGLPPTSVIDGVTSRGHRVRVTRHDLSHGPSMGKRSARRTLLRADLLATVPADTPIEPEPAPTPPPHDISIEGALTWAAEHLPPEFLALRAIAEALSPVPLTYSEVPEPVAVAYTLPKIVEAVTSTEASVHAFTERLKVEPVGRLHLERLEMTPAGIERGELVYSVPLTPKETVNLSHREWAIRAEEYTSILRDAFEGYSEQGVTEKVDIARATDNQARHESALNVGAAANASYLGVTVSSSVGYTAGSGDMRAQRDSRNESVAATRRASARVKKDHTTSFRVSSVAGTEDRAVRVIHNPSETKAMRVDYYQMMRRWQVDLYRYDIRMTYDLAIPNPGADLLRKIEEITAIDATLKAPLDFSVKVGDITRHNWRDLATKYQAEVEPPPLRAKTYMASGTVQCSEDEARVHRAGTIELDVDTEYDISKAEVDAAYFWTEGADGPEDCYFDILFDSSSPETSSLFEGRFRSSLAGLIHKSGKVTIPYVHKGIAAASINVVMTALLRVEHERAWQLSVWSALRAGAEQRYQESRQKLQDRRAQLEAELNQFDALTLRQMELEEIMKGVLRWLFGPGFEIVPKDIQALFEKMDAHDPFGRDALDPSRLSNQDWMRMMEYGEFIKFIHQAIEWENVLYFTYPYFWDTPSRWPLKRFLNHPDALHRKFLRAGSARVVLTIRPGFEESFAAMMETGAFGSLPGDHPYMTIAREIEAYAKTNYPGIPPANPESPPTESEVDEQERGVLIARWWEYTPTGALDLSINTSLADMA